MRGGSGGGEIVEVEGGHIVRSTGRKDRHSKVCTAKGPRDRRVRLSADTAIQFYDVQDRLGYDRPSKAVDWLIQKAKPAIDELAQLPPWNPTTTNNNNNLHHKEETENPIWLVGINENQDNIGGGGCGFLNPHNNNNEEDLRLSLQSLQDPILLQNQNMNMNQHHVVGFDGMVAWNLGAADTDNNNNNGGGFIFNNNNPLGQSQYLSSQRGPLQSSNNPSIRAWIDASPSMLAADHHQHYLLPAAMMHHSVPGIGFASGGFSGFRVPAARIQGQEEEHDGISNKLSSVASVSRPLN